MAYSFSIAKDVLSDKDRDRLACLYLNRIDDKLDNTINFEKATAEFGAKSVDSMKVMTRAVLKKIAEAGGKTNGNSEASTPKKAGGRKRKAAQNDDDDDEALPAPKKKGRGKKKAKDVTPDVDDEDTKGVKDEPKSEGEGEEYI